jgi:ElaB/YqjD/DUF883 family membrane-anchored ribosome-binding protein
MNGQQKDLYSQTADWLVSAARRKPEALLLFAAGCALMMRGTGKGSAWRRSATDHPGDVYGEGPSYAGGIRSGPAAAGLNRAAEKVTEYAGEVRDRVGDTAGAYASSMADYAEDARRRVGDYAGEFRDNLSAVSDQVAAKAQSAAQMTSDTLRDQPVLIAALGLAAGAAVAAFLPTSEVERRTLRPAGDALAGAAGQAGENLMARATRVGEQVQKSAAERGLSTEGLKDMAHQAAETFTRSPSDSSQGMRGSTATPTRSPSDSSQGLRGSTTTPTRGPSDSSQGLRGPTTTPPRPSTF